MMRLIVLCLVFSFLIECGPDSMGVKEEVNLDPGYVVDVDGNVYKTIRIGDQIWTASDLRVTRYNDGTLIPLVEDSLVWDKLNSPAYCWYNNDKQATINSAYGALYNWYAVNTEKLAPKGWHIPNTSEIEKLCEYLGGSKTLSGYNYVGEMLKIVDTLYWMRPNLATNSSGFSAVGGGTRENIFTGKKLMNVWWLQTGSFLTFSNYHYVWIDPDLKRSKHFTGMSVRCIKD